ncbi:MAG: glutaredoxin family protein [Nitrospirae bacterium]|nr:MAG: glutaredoxin family protein [Nitrospirota bacterium]
MADEKKVVLFALSTCPACKKTKALLNELGVEAVVVDLDTVDRESRDKLLEEVRKFNPRETFPTLVINKGEKVVVGYSDEEIREALS